MVAAMLLLQRPSCYLIIFELIRIFYMILNNYVDVVVWCIFIKWFIFIIYLINIKNRS